MGVKWGIAHWSNSWHGHAGDDASIENNIMLGDGIASVRRRRRELPNRDNVKIFRIKIQILCFLASPSSEYPCPYLSIIS